MPSALNKCFPESGWTGRPGLLVFSDDWGRHPSSCQHLVRRLLGRYPVWWVNTIGMRRPRWDRATWLRAWEKLCTWFGLNASWASPRANTEGGWETAAALTVLSPWMWPWFSTPLDRRINRALLLRALEPVVRRWPGPVVGVTTLPIVADLMGPLPVDRWVYYCVDDFSQWPGLDHQAIQAMEHRLIEQADLVIAASLSLQERLAGLGRSARLLTHGVDLDHWRRPSASEPKAIGEPKEVLLGLNRLASSCQRPWLVFWGLVDRRMDVEWLSRLAADLHQGTILLVGPTDDPDPRLQELSRVRLPGPVDYEHLPLLAQQADVLIMPYADLPVTRAMQPLKLLEYLATGKPVVVRGLPAVEAWTDALDAVSTAEAFSAMVRQRAAEGLPADQAQARQRLRAETWDAKAQLFERWILEGLRTS